jgi:hypothetical protein
MLLAAELVEVVDDEVVVVEAWTWFPYWAWIKVSEEKRTILLRGLIMAAS